MKQYEPESDCCGAALLGEDDDYICGECKEHCDATEDLDEPLPKGKSLTGFVSYLASVGSK